MKTKIAFVPLTVVVVVATLVLAIPAQAQFARATLSGAVIDPGGLALPGVTVTVTNTATGATRTLITSATGRFIFNGLVPGPYLAVFTMDSFRTVQREGLELNVGQDSTLNITMELGGIEETVTVTALSPMVDVTSKEVGATVTTEDMDVLPTQNRSFIDFAALIPGVVPNPRTGSTASDSIFVNGQDNNNNSFNVDGANNDDDVIGARAGAQTRTAIEAIQEFQILTTQFDAEFGRTQGAVINAVTKSGTNTFHGVGFYYLQDSDFNAKNFFTERNDLEQPDFKFQSMGGVLGGPVVKDKVHFFVSFERLTPETGVARNFETRPELNFVTTEDNLLRNWLLKGDVQVAPNHKAAIRYLREFSPQKNQIIGNDTALSAAREESDTDQNFISSFDSVIGDRGFNNFRFSFTEEDVAFANTGFNEGGKTFDVQRSLGVSLDRPTVLEGITTVASARINQSFQFDDTFSLFVPDWGGDHNIRVGASYSNRSVEFNNSSTANGQFDFDTDVPFNPNDINLYPEFFNIRVGGASGQNVDVPSNDVIGLFFQDDWQPVPNLTLNLGVRYDRESITNDDNNLGPRVGITWDPTGEGRTAIRGGYGRFYERLQLGDAVAWDDFFLDAVQLPGGFVTRVPDSGSDKQFFFDTAMANGITTLNALRDFLAAGLESGAGLVLLNTQPQVDNPARIQPYADTFSVGISHEVAEAMSVGFDFIHTRNRNIRLRVDLNPFSLAAGGRPNISILDGEVLPGMGSILSSVNEGESDYNGLQFSFRRRFQDSKIGRFSYRVAYTFADQSGNAQAGGIPADSLRFQTRTETGFNFDTGELIGEAPNLNLDDLQNINRPSPWFRKHNFVTAWSYLLPGTSWAANQGLYVTGIFRYMSGDRDHFESRTRGDNNQRLVAPAGTYTANRTSDIAQTIDFDGTLNGFENPDFTKLDLSFRYAIPIMVDYEVTILADFFNLTNEVNFDGTGSDFIEDGGFLLPSSAFAPRNFQFGIKFTF